MNNINPTLESYLTCIVESMLNRGIARVQVEPSMICQLDIDDFISQTSKFLHQYPHRYYYFELYDGNGIWVISRREREVSVRDVPLLMPSGHTIMPCSRLMAARQLVSSAATLCDLQIVDWEFAEHNGERAVVRGRGDDRTKVRRWDPLHNEADNREIREALYHGLGYPVTVVRNDQHVIVTCGMVESKFSLSVCLSDSPECEAVVRFATAYLSVKRRSEHDGLVD